MKVYGYDLEQLSNLHTATFISVDRTEIKQFVIHSLRDDREAYLDFLSQEGLRLIGYNCNAYDYQLIHRLLVARNSARFTSSSSKQLSEWLYAISQDVIASDVAPVPEWNFLIPHRDLFKVHHFDNKNRRVSLKALQMAMNFHNVQDMPIHHETFITTMEEINTVLEYNFNDVESTLDFYDASDKEISMRRDIGRAFNMYVMNANDAKIGQEIILKKVAEKKSVSVKSLRDLRTYRKAINIKDIILPYVEFQSPEFQKVLKAFQSRKIDPSNTKGALTYSAVYDGMVYEYGYGGLHACREANSWHNEDNLMIKSADVASYYPNLAIKNRFHPEHLGDDFCDVYEELYFTRKEYPKGTPQNYGLKIALNGAYGKSNDVYSPLYDPKMTMQITINGQLLLSMLCEWVTQIGCKVIMVNTDGIEVQVPLGLEAQFYSACKRWETMTQLELEQTSYKSLFIRDVNNYIGVFSSGDIYLKGAYEIDKAWHKNHSMKIVPIAVREFFVNKTPVMNTLRNHKNIYDFMLHVRVREAAKFVLKKIDEGMNVTEEILPKTNRYVVVQGGVGGYLYKHFESGKISKVTSGHKVLMCNDMSPLGAEFSDNDYLDFIDYRYYYNEAMKLISPIIRNQLNLF